MHMQKLIDREPKRIFTFGCSFTKYLWGTWANIIGAEFQNAEFYNLGRASVGNKYIHNIVMQADNVYNFNKSDLVIIQWTNPYREDRYLPENHEDWLLSGNIFYQNHYPKEWTEKWFDMYGAYVYDFAYIKSVHGYLKNKTRLHMLKMIDFQHPVSYKELEDKIDNLYELYKESLNEIPPSFFKVLWKNKLDAKFYSDRKLVHPKFKDGHPNPMEHHYYLKQTFRYNWRNETEKKVSEAQIKWIKLMQDAIEKGYVTDQSNIDGFRFNEYLKANQVDSKHFMRGSNDIDSRIHR